jgi:DNA-binding response OmpR family regulator
MNDSREFQTTAKLVLIVDDDPNVRESLELMVSQAGYRVQTASSGLEGISLAWGDEKPFAIIFDIMMTDMDGFDMAGRLYHAEKTKGVPLILLTTPSGLKDRRRGARNNMNFITKPFRPSQLLGLLENFKNPTVDSAA